MKNLPGPIQLSLSCLLLMVMIATRFHHFGDLLHLPDASMAVFFLGGLYLRRHLGYAVFLLAAVAIDYFAITGRGLNFFDHYCVTPSYAFLLLAYAVLWYAGRWYAPRMPAGWRGFGRALGVAFAAASVSFLISNGAFYWFGGRYAEPNFAEYLSRVWRWGPLFVRTTMSYIAVAFVAHAAIARIARPPASQPTTNR